MHIQVKSNIYKEKMYITFIIQDITNGVLFFSEQNTFELLENKEFLLGDFQTLNIQFMYSAHTYEDSYRPGLMDALCTLIFILHNNY